MAGSNGRLVGEVSDVKEVLPLEVFDLETKPENVSIREMSRDCLGQAPYHSAGSSHSRDAADAGCRAVQMALSPLERERSWFC